MPASATTEGPQCCHRGRSPRGVSSGTITTALSVSTAEVVALTPSSPSSIDACGGGEQKPGLVA